MVIFFFLIFFILHRAHFTELFIHVFMRCHFFVSGHCFSVPAVLE